MLTAVHSYNCVQATKKLLYTCSDFFRTTTNISSPDRPDSVESCSSSDSSRPASAPPLPPPPLPPTCTESQRAHAA